MVEASITGQRVTSTAPPPLMLPTSSGLVALADQLHAAVTDVWGAWVEFVMGGQPVENQPDQPAPSDRLEYTFETMNAQISRLRELSRTIRDRV